MNMNLTTTGIYDYDYVIVGAGPAGLTFAHLAAKEGKSVLILEKNSSVGGCHRVDRVNGLFSEHGPRVISGAYKNFKEILKEMTLNFRDLYKKYHFSISSIGGNVITQLKPYELLKFTGAFLRLTWNHEYGRNISMEQFTRINSFTKESKDYLDRLCRLTDGAGSDRYSLNEFLELINQQWIYSLYQPKEPNDTGLFRLWTNYLLATGKVTIKLNEYVENISKDPGGYFNVKSTSSSSWNSSWAARKVILAIPPVSLSYLVDGFSSYAEKSKYVQYISVSFHWNSKLTLPKVWGFPKTDYGLAFIVVSDYFFENPNTPTVISTAVTLTDSISNVTGKTANECEFTELTQEMLRQLRESFPNLPDPDAIVMSPSIKKVKGKWINEDTAFVKAADVNYIPFEISSAFPGLYTLGTHNGYSKYKFTSLESAVSNAIELHNRLHHGNGHGKLPVSGPFELTALIKIIVVALFVLVIVLGRVYVHF